MKILIVHNDYAKYSGEEAVVDKMASMFRQHGHDVCFYRKTTANLRKSLWGQVRAFWEGIYSPSGVIGIRKVIEREKPDIINVHNLYPFISPASLFECRKEGIPVVMTIHNFRVICPTGLFMRNHKPCECCLLKKNEWDCVKYNCEHSILKSTGYAFRNMYARWTGAYRKNVTMYACITEFQQRKLIEANYDANKIIVIPNFIDPPFRYTYIRGTYVAFCGRLSQEKGVDLILNVARRHPEISFKFAGELRDLEILSNGIPENCELMGYLSGKELDDFYQNAAFCVMASKWYEGFPMSILEAAKFGKCVIGPDHGGFSEIIGQRETAIGRLFKPNDEFDLENKIMDLWNNPDIVEKLGKKSFEKLRREYCSEVIYEKWMNLFNKIINEK